MKTLQDVSPQLRAELLWAAERYVSTETPEDFAELSVEVLDAAGVLSLAEILALQFPISRNAVLDRPGYRSSVDLLLDAIPVVVTASDTNSVELNSYIVAMMEAME